MANEILLICWRLSEMGTFDNTARQRAKTIVIFSIWALVYSHNFFKGLALRLGPARHDTDTTYAPLAGCSV